jgi:uncharacterized protein YcfL
MMKRSKGTWPLVAGVAAAILVAGCTVRSDEGTRGGVRVADPRLPGTQLRLNNVAFVDKGLEQRVAVELTNSRRTETDTFEAFAELRNRTDYPVQVECRVLWYDKAEVQVDNPTAWQRVYMEANSRGTCRESSGRVDGITHYYIEIREGRR